MYSKVSSGAELLSVMRFAHKHQRKKTWTLKRNAAIIVSSEVTMFPLLSPSTRGGIQSHFPVIEFEPLSDGIETAARQGL